MIGATKQICQPLTRILAFVSHVELPNDLQSLECSDYLDPGYCVAIFMHEHTIRRPATIKSRESSRITSFRLIEYIISQREGEK